MGFYAELEGFMFLGLDLRLSLDLLLRHDFLKRPKIVIHIF